MKPDALLTVFGWAIAHQSVNAVVWVNADNRIEIKSDRAAIVAQLYVDRVPVRKTEGRTYDSALQQLTETDEFLDACYSGRFVTPFPN